MQHIPIKHTLEKNFILFVFSGSYRFQETRSLESLSAPNLLYLSNIGQKNHSF